MAIGYLDSQKLTNIANSIRTKLGSENTYTVDQMPTAITSIPAPEAPRVFKDVNFYDWDGTILYQYTLQEARALTAMPALPTPPEGYEIYNPYDGSQGWTETLSYIQNLTMPCDVGVNYSALDSNTKTKVHIETPYDGAVVVTKVNSGLYINWGDDSGDKYYSTIAVERHTYAHAGTYTISTWSPNRTACPQWPYTGYGPCFVLEDEAMTAFYSSNYPVVAKYSLITGVEYGANLWSGALTFYGSYRITSLLLPTNAYNGPSPLRIQVEGTSIKHLTVPYMTNTGYLYGSTYVTNMLQRVPYETVVFPSRDIQRNAQIDLSTVAPKKLRRLVVDAGTANIRGNNAVFRNVDSIEECYIKGNFTVDPYQFFMDCHSLKKVSLIGLSGTVGNSLFENCYSLERVNLSDMFVINDYAFLRSSIKNIDLSQVRVVSTESFKNTLVETINLNNVASIGSSAFIDCHSLHEVTIGPNVISIGGGAFQKCDNLHVVYIKATTPPDAGSAMFYGAANDLVIYVPAGTLTTYQAATNWSTYASNMQEVVEITDYKSLTLSTTATPDGWDEYCPATATLIADGVNRMTGETVRDQAFIQDINCYIGVNDTEAPATKTISYTWPNSGLTASTSVTQGVKTNYCKFTTESIATGWGIPNDTWPGVDYRLPDGSGYTSYIKQKDSSNTNSCYLEIEFAGYSSLTFYVHCHAGEWSYVKLDTMVTSSNYDYRVNQTITTNANATDITDTTQWYPITYSGLDTSQRHHIYIYQNFKPNIAGYGQYCVSVAVDNNLLTN